MKKTIKNLSGIHLKHALWGMLLIFATAFVFSCGGGDDEPDPNNPGGGEADLAVAMTLNQ